LNASHAEGKIFEQILFPKLRDLIDPSLSNEQHGFRQGRSCGTALSLLIQDVLNGIDGSKVKVGAVFIDIKKVVCSANKFLLVDPYASKFSFCYITIKIISDCLTGRLICGEYKSQSFAEVNSVPQGSSLGPLLFAVFIDDIAKLQSQFPGTGFKFYAEDVVIYAYHKSTDSIIDLLNSTLFIVHRTEAMLFPKKYEPTPEELSITIVEDSIKVINRLKYLGLILDPQLNFKLHFNGC